LIIYFIHSGNLLSKKRFDNTIAHCMVKAGKTVFAQLQTCGAFIAAFTSGKTMDENQVYSAIAYSNPCTMSN
jgi:hypothetical protein